MATVIQRIQAEQTRINEMTVKLTVAQGKFLVQGAGRVLVNVPFPVWFSAEPHFTVGVVLDRNYIIDYDNIPGWDAMVTGWDLRNTAPGFEGYYVGAEILFVVSGLPEQQVWVNWRMEGKALRNPVGEGAEIYQGRQTV